MAFSQEEILEEFVGVARRYSAATDNGEYFEGDRYSFRVYAGRAERRSDDARKVREREYTKRYYRERILADPAKHERQKQWRKRWHAKNRTKRNAEALERFHRIRADPVKYAEYLKKHRAAAKARRERAKGLKLKPNAGPQGATQW